ncbi:hypothetical protein BELL_0515g00030 [Botrytis elliptica]|uniref:Uncharacterized protein n=1 Tax=Botrytis elliptica TaxID=278938 RepID=A0A4Z1JKY9_9HELO|nr:hypothetical protein BELL_0515g00030 [Botrytis elliptica]
MLLSNINIYPTLNFLVLTIVTSIAYRIIYNLYFHPLAKFRGPWYSSCFSLPLAIISIKRWEHQWVDGLIKKYGSVLSSPDNNLSGDAPIRVAPEMLLFPRPSALKDIYWDRSLNEKSTFYGTGLFGPPSLFTTLPSVEHVPLRKALGAAPVSLMLIINEIQTTIFLLFQLIQELFSLSLTLNIQWAIGDVRKDWERSMDDQILLFTKIMAEKAKAGETVDLCDKLAEFAADIMTIFSFNQPWGFVKASRDERGLLHNWRETLDFIGFTARFTFFRKYILSLPGVASWALPEPSSQHGMGYLIHEADRAITQREYEVIVYGHCTEFCSCLDARINDEPLTPLQKRSHVTLLIQAGADTTGTALGAIIRFLATTPGCYAKALAQIREAEAKNLLSTPIQDEEVRAHLPYLIGAVKEGMRLNPSVTNWLPRIVPPEGKMINGFFVPGGMDVTSQAMVVQRDPILFGPDPDVFRPERWMDGQDVELEHGMFIFGVGPRVCLGKEIALMETYKLVSEVGDRWILGGREKGKEKGKEKEGSVRTLVIVRRFDIEVIEKGTYISAGGISYNEGFIVKMHPQTVD